MVTRPEEFAVLPYQIDLVGFRAEDGFPLDGLLYSPKVGATTAVILVHGKTCNFLGGPSRFLPLSLAQAGYASFAVNMRVHSLGYSRGDVPFENFDNFIFIMAGGAWEKLEDGHKDLGGAVAYLRRLGFEKIVLAGHSSGGFYAGDYAGRESRAALWKEKFRDVIKTPRKELVFIRNAEHMYLGHEDEVADAVISFLKKYTA